MGRWRFSLMIVLVLCLSSGPAAAETTIRHLVRGDQTVLAYFRDAAARFMAERPHINVELELVGSGDYFDKLSLLVASGTAPDATWANPGSNFYFYAHRGYWLPLDSFVQRDRFDLTQFYQKSVQMATYGGHLYGVPYQSHPGLHGLWYNQTLFDTFGTARPTDSWTYEDLRLAGKKLSRDLDGDGQVDQWGVFINPANRPAFTVVLSNGGELLSADGMRGELLMEETIRSFEFLSELVHQDRVLPLANQQKGPMTGQLGMSIIGAWQVVGFQQASVPFEWGVASIPLGQHGRLAYLGSTDLYVILQDARHPDEAWQWIKFLTSKDSLRRQYEYLSNPTSNHATNVALLSKMPHYRVFVEALLAETHRPPFKPANLRQNDFESLLTQGLRPIWDGKEAVKTALEKLQAQVNALLAEPLQ